MQDPSSASPPKTPSATEREPWAAALRDLPNPLAAPWLLRGLTGFRYFTRAVGFLYRDQPLRRVSRWIIGLNVFLYLGPVATLALIAFEFAHLVHPENALVEASPLLAQVVAAGTRAVTLALSFSVAVVALFLSLVVGKVFTSPLVDAISERAEARLFHRKKPLWHILLSIWTSIKELMIQLALLAVHFPIILGLFALAHVPSFGPWLALLLGYIWTALWISLSVLSNVAGRHGCGAFQRLALVIRQAPLFVGFAGLAALVPGLLLPIGLPALTAGATELYLALVAQGRLPHTFLSVPFEPDTAVLPKGV